MADQEVPGELGQPAAPAANELAAAAPAQDDAERAAIR